MIEFSKFGTIVLYLFIVFGGVWFSYLAEKSEKKKLYIFFAYLIITIPQAFRYMVGIDYRNSYELATEFGRFTDVTKAIAYRSSTETAYKIIMFYSVKIFSSPFWGYSLYSFLTQLFVLKGIWNWKLNISPSVVTFIYLCTFYWRTYNLIRQSLAVAIVFFALVYLYNKRIVRYIILVLIASLFHKSAIVGIGFLLFYIRPRQNDVSKRSYMIYYYISLVVPIVAMIFSDVLINKIVNLSIFSSYEVYTDYDSRNISVYHLFLWTSQLVLYFYFRKQKYNDENRDLSIVVLDKAIVCDYIFSILSYSIGFASRIGLYFTLPCFLSVGNMWTERETKTSFTVFQLYIICVSLLKLVALLNDDRYGIIPYIFLEN